MIKKEVFFISKPVCPPWNDSSKNYVRDLLIQLKDDIRYSFRALGAKDSNFVINNVITEKVYTNSGCYKPRFWQNCLIFFRLLKRKNDSIYHFFFAPNFLTSLCCSLIVKFLRVKSVQTILSSPKSYKHIKKLIFADKVITLSDYTKDKLIENGVSNVVRIFPGINCTEFNYDKQMIDQNKMKLGINAEKVVLFAGDYEFGNGPSNIISIVKSVLSRIPKTKFVLACRIKTSMALAEERKIKNKAKELGITDSLIFLNEVNNMPLLIKSCDVCVFPVDSLYAKMDIPMILLEALKASKPIIINEIYPLREIFKDKIGIVVDIKNKKSLSTAIISVLEDDSLARSMGIKGREIVKKYFNIENSAKEYINIYSTLLRT